MKILLTAILMCFTSLAFSAEDVVGKTIEFVYQPDLAVTEFDFAANRQNGCGSNLYRVSSADVQIANRKFSLVLAAFSAGKKLSFHDRGVCEGNRSMVSWVKITS